MSKKLVAPAAGPGTALVSSCPRWVSNKSLIVAARLMRSMTFDVQVAGVFTSLLPGIKHSDLSDMQQGLVLAAHLSLETDGGLEHSGSYREGCVGIHRA